MPESKCFASGDTIAVALRIACPRAPALARLLAHNAHLSLVKRQKTWISLGAQISVREQLLSRAECYLADESREGTVYLRLEVEAGAAAREASWKVADVAAVEVRALGGRCEVGAHRGFAVVQYMLRLVVLPPEHLKDFPAYRCDVPLNVTTDQYGSLQSEVLAMGGIPFPALGLNDVQRYLRPA